MSNHNKIMKESEKMNACELIEKLAKSEMKKELLIKILELQEVGKNDSEIMKEIKNFLKEDEIKKNSNNTALKNPLWDANL